VETLQTILNAVPNPVFLKDRLHRLILVNDAMCELMCQRRDEMVDRSDIHHFPDEQTEVFWKVDDEVFTTGLPNENEEVLTDGTGALRVIVTRKRLIHLPTSEGEQPFIIAVISDVTRFREAEARAQYLAEHDALTGLANRTQLSDRLTAAIEVARKTDAKVALLLLDLDGFKTVNDRYGHPAGDELLRVIAKRLAGLVRTVDTVSRFGGDEFCIVQAAVQQPSAAFGLAERIISSISRPVVVGSARMSVSASIGIALFPDDGTMLEPLLQKADKALYTVKRSGRRGYLQYDDRPSVPHPREWDIEGNLRAALAGDQLSLAFQPLVAAADGKMRGFEALVRWLHPTRGEISPDVFIPVAESTGLIQQLGAWALHKACVAAASWPWDLQVSVNVSPAQLENDDLPAVVESALASSELPASRLELEVTETALLGSTERVSVIFAKLKTLGVGLALDDFGAGWSSLATLRTFPFDRIKIDRSFIASIESDARSVAIVRAVLSLGQALEVPVTAEGVETQAQLVALRQMGCAELQGFYLGHPHAEATLPGTQPWRGFHRSELSPST
jgi:diguanylate cyclase (GGDEF)-like protein/PAS domain S-box-containing protein